MLNFFFHIIVLVCLRLFACLGMNFVFGKMKVLYFGHIAYLILLIYPLWVSHMMFDLSYGVSVLITCVALVLGAFLFTYLSIRLKEDAFGVMSIALHLMFLAVVLNSNELTRGALGIPKIPRSFFPGDTMGFALVIAAATILWCIFVWWIDRGKLGRQMTALSEHPWYAESLGVSRASVYFMAYLVSGVGLFLTAIFYPPYVYLLTPQDFAFPTLVLYIMIIVAGGPGNFWGIVFACFALTFLGEGMRFVGMSASLVGPMRLMLFGSILFVSVWLRRDSLFPKQRTV